MCEKLPAYWRGLLAEIAWLAHRLPEPEGTHLQELARSYAEEVIHKEWPLMEQGQAPLMI
jgi:hypothetical protein